jgi:phage tail-like protein
MASYAPGDRATALSKKAKSPDPVAGIGFKVAVDNITVGLFAECSGIAVEYEIMEYGEGGENTFTHKLRGRLKYPNLVLKRGVTYETALLNWFFEVKKRGMGSALTVSLIGSDGQPVRTWAFTDSMPVKWTGPTLNSGASSVATESLEIAHGGFKFPLE